MSTRVEEKTVLCASCDIACQLHAEVTDGRVTRIKAHSNPILRDNICMKGIYAPKAFAHPDRILHPLKRKGERGSGEWTRVGWDEAMGEIAEQHGLWVIEDDIYRELAPEGAPCLAALEGRAYEEVHAQVR